MAELRSITEEEFTPTTRPQRLPEDLNVWSRSNQSSPNALHGKIPVKTRHVFDPDSSNASLRFESERKRKKTLNCADVPRSVMQWVAMRVPNALCGRVEHRSPCHTVQ